MISLGQLPSLIALQPLSPSLFESIFKCGYLNKVWIRIAILLIDISLRDLRCYFDLCLTDSDSDSTIANTSTELLLCDGILCCRLSSDLDHIFDT